MIASPKPPRPRWRQPWRAGSDELGRRARLNDTAQARLVDRAMRPWRSELRPTRFGCAVMALTRKTAAGHVVATSTITLDLVSYPGAPGMVLRALDDPDVSAPADAPAER